MAEINSTIEVKPGKILRVYTKKETWAFEKEWMQTFFQNKQGANTGAYKWHIFSFEKYPALSGDKAFNKYIQQKASEYIVLSNDNDLAIATDELPTECNIMDYYVFPKNMAWTMAFTHEDGWLGSYFATHKSYESLNTDNVKQFIKKEKKQKEIEIAKKNGWL